MILPIFSGNIVTWNLAMLLRTTIMQAFRGLLSDQSRSVDGVQGYWTFH